MEESIPEGGAGESKGTSFFHRTSEKKKPEEKRASRFFKAAFPWEPMASIDRTWKIHTWQDCRPS